MAHGCFISVFLPACPGFLGGTKHGSNISLQRAAAVGNKTGPLLPPTESQPPDQQLILAWCHIQSSSLLLSGRQKSQEAISQGKALHAVFSKSWRRSCFRRGKTQQRSQHTTAPLSDSTYIRSRQHTYARAHTLLQALPSAPPTTDTHQAMMDAINSGRLAVTDAPLLLRGSTPKIRLRLWQHVSPTEFVPQRSGHLGGPWARGGPISMKRSHLGGEEKGEEDMINLRATWHVNEGEEPPEN
ncbi:hypothetical protein MHYP_G00041320 [Metynnis hypsauchen]